MPVIQRSARDSKTPYPVWERQIRESMGHRCRRTPIRSQPPHTARRWRHLVASAHGPMDFGDRAIPKPTRSSYGGRSMALPTLRLKYSTHGSTRPMESPLCFFSCPFGLWVGDACGVPCAGRAWRHGLRAGALGWLCACSLRPKPQIFTSLLYLVLLFTLRAKTAPKALPLFPSCALPGAGCTVVA